MFKLLTRYYIQSIFKHTFSLQNVKDEYNCGFYVNKSGDMQWLGVTKTTKQRGSVTRRTYSSLDQARLKDQLKPSLVPVAKSLHDEGYFGIVGCDLLLDSEGNQYVIDINPRLNTSTIAFLLSKPMEQKGYQVGVMHAGSVSIKGNLRDAIEICETVEDGDIFIQSAVEEDNYTRCFVTLFGHSEEASDALLAQIAIPDDHAGFIMNKFGAN